MHLHNGGGAVCLSDSWANGGQWTGGLPENTLKSNACNGLSGRAHCIEMIAFLLPF